MKMGILPVTAYQQNCSLIWCEKTMESAIVDPGGDLDKIRSALGKTGTKPVAILLTHGHLDHAAGAKELAESLEIPIWGPHKGDDYWLEQLPQTCQAMGFPPANAYTPDRWLEEGETLSIGEETLQVIHCPGHTPGHLVFYNAKERFALVGDVLFQGSIGRTDFPGGDHDTLISSIRDKLFPLGDDITFIPGHGPISTFGDERKSNPFVADNRFG